MSKGKRIKAKATASEPMGQPGALWQRALQMGDPKLGCEIGRLHFAHKMTATEVEMAAHAAQIYGRYERLSGLKRSSKSPSYEIGYGRGGETAENDRDGQATRSWRELQSQIPLFPPWLQGAFEQLVIEDRHIGDNELKEVRALLCDLARFYKSSSEKRKSGPRPQRLEKPSTGATKLPRSSIERDYLHEAAIQLGINLTRSQIDELYERTLTLKFRKLHREQATARIHKLS